MKYMDEIMDEIHEIHVHKTKKSICAHFAESPCRLKTY